MTHITKFSKAKKPKKSHREAYYYVSEVSIAERAQVWDQKKKEKQERMRQENQQREIQKCTFKPKIKSQKRFQKLANSKAHQSEFLKEGLSEYFHRVQRAKRMKTEGGILGYKGQELPDLERKSRQKKKYSRSRTPRSKKNPNQTFNKSKPRHPRKKSHTKNQMEKKLRASHREPNRDERFSPRKREVFTSNQDHLFKAHHDQEENSEPEHYLHRVGSPPSSTFSSKYYEHGRHNDQNNFHKRRHDRPNLDSSISQDELDLKELLNRKKAKLMKKKREFGIWNQEEIELEGNPEFGDSRKFRGAKHFENQTKCLVQGLFSSNETGSLAQLGKKERISENPKIADLKSERTKDHQNRANFEDFNQYQDHLDEEDLQKIRNHYLPQYPKEFSQHDKRERKSSNQAGFPKRAHGYNGYGHRSPEKAESMGSSSRYHYEFSQRKKEGRVRNDERLPIGPEGRIHQVARNDFIEHLQDNQMKTGNLEESGKKFDLFEVLYFF